MALRILRIITGALLGALVPVSALAQAVQPPVVCGGILPCFTGSGGAAGLDEYLTGKVLFVLQMLFAGLLIVMLFVYGANAILKSNDEGSITESKLAYVHAITGAAFVSFAIWITQAFTPYNASAVINYDPVNSVLTNTYLYFRLLLGVVLTVNIVFQAFRLITSQGSDEQTDKAKKRLIAGFIGVGVVLLVNSFVIAFQPGNVVVGSGGAGLIVMEIMGIARFLLILFGAGATLSIIAAGIYLLISVDESLKEKAKQMIRTSLIALAVVLASLAIVQSFILLDS